MTINTAHTRLDMVPRAQISPLFEPKSGTAAVELFKRFTIFPKLPIEIRMMIWREAFPDGQHVCIGPEEDFGITLDDARSRNPPIAPLKLPVTLHLNRESRQETLKTYAVFFSQDCKEYADHGGASHLLVFAPKRDSAYVYFDRLDPASSSKLMSNRFNIWMRHLEKNILGGLTSIKTLEIRNAEKIFFRVDRLLIPKSYRAWFPLEGSQQPKFLSGIRWFTGLENLHVTMEKSVGFSAISPRRSNKLEEELFRWCKTYAKKCDKYNAPKIVVRKWDKMARLLKELEWDIDVWISYKARLNALAE